MVKTSVSYKQYRNIPVYPKETRVVFNGKTYVKLVELLLKTVRDNREYGVYFLGELHEFPNESYLAITDFSSDFESGDTFIEVTGENFFGALDILERNARKEGNSSKPAMIHFHTHPRKLYYENFSDQDLHIYADSEFRYNCGGNVAHFGMLGFPIPKFSKRMGISLVRPMNSEKNLYSDEYKADFYRYENFFYTEEDEFEGTYTFNEFFSDFIDYPERIYNPEIINGIVKNYVNNFGRCKYEWFS